MTILHIAPHLSCDAGQAGILLRGLLQASPAAGMNPVLVTLEDSAEDSANIPQGIEHRLASSADVDSIMGTAQAVHVHGLDLRAAKVWQARARAHRVGCVISPLGRWSDPGNQPTTLPGRMMSRLSSNGWVHQARAVIALNDADAASLGSQLPNADIRLLPLGINTADYDVADASIDLPPAPDGRLALVLAPLNPGEGCTVLLRAFAELGLATEGWSIVLAGPDPGAYRKALEAGVRRKGGSDQVLITAAPDLATQRAWLRRASLLIAPAQRVSPPTSILQAAALGVPVLATTLIAPAHLQDAMATCSPQRVDMKEALRNQLACTREQLEATGQTLRNRCRQSCDWKVLVEQYAELYASAKQRTPA